MKSTGKMGLLMIGVVLIMSAAAEDCVDQHRDYCCMDFTAERIGAEAKLHDDLFNDECYHDTIASYCQIEYKKCHEATGDKPLLLIVDGDKIDDYRNAISSELSILKGAINLTKEGACFVQDQKANIGMSNDAQKCEELVYGMELIVQTLSEYLMYHNCGCADSVCKYDPDAVVLPERNEQITLSDAAIQLFIPYARIKTGVNTLDCMAAPECDPFPGQ